MRLQDEIIKRIGELVETDPLYSQKCGDLQTYNEFLDKFPANRIGEISLDDYCIGDNSAENKTFCWFIERGLEKAFGRYSPGNARGHLIYKPNNGELYINSSLRAAFPNTEQALKYVLRLHQAVATITDPADWGQLDDESIFERADIERICSIGVSRKIRLLSIYNPTWVVPINSTTHLAHFIETLALDETVPNNALQRAKMMTEIFSQIKRKIQDLTPYGFMEVLYSEALGIQPPRNRNETFIYKLNQGAITHGYINLRKNQSFFAPEYFCKSNNEPIETFQMELPDGSQLECWCLSDYGRIRQRFGKLFAENNLSEGDEVHISLIDENAYRMEFAKRDLSDVEYLKAKFLYHMEGFKSFDVSKEIRDKYFEVERSYKDDLIAKFSADCEPLVSDVSLSNFENLSIYENFIKILQSPSQNIVSWQQVDKLKKTLVSDEDIEEFIGIFAKFLHQPALNEDGYLSEENFKDYTESVQNLFANTQFPISRASDSRDLPMFLLMLTYPDRHICIKTTALKKACQNILGEPLKNGAFSFEIYDQMKRLAQKTKDILSSWGWNPQDMIDVQSFLWVVFDYDEIDIPNEAKSVGEYKKEVSMPLNTIFYGPPGTGKTFETVKRAVKLIDPAFTGDQEAFKRAYDSYVATGQIRFVTFHQSFSYEDFVEGIRPVADDNGNLTYPVVSGIFKEICEEASSKSVASPKAVDVFSSTIWKMSLGNTLGDDAEIYDECIERNYVLLGYGEELDFSGCNDRESIYVKFKEAEKGIKETDYPVSAVHTFKNRIKNGDLIIISDGNRKFRAIGKVVGDYKFIDDADRGTYLQSREVEWVFVSDTSLPYDRIMNKAFSQMTLYKPTERALSKKKLADFLAAGTTKVDNLDKNYVLIIDEINRGNISRIFGELITLVEDTKRGHQSVVLPYSKDSFSVPKNLYLLGTMNTADRSLAGLDIALRRRFRFEEMMPQPELLERVAGIDLKKMLSVMNERIEVLLGRDYVIGHSYLMNMGDSPDIRNIADVFSQKIIPLLQEYFFEDWERISWVLNDQRKFDPNLRFIRKTSENGTSLSDLLGDVGGLSDSEDRRWEVNRALLLNPQADAFIQIYSWNGEASEIVE